MANKIKTIKLTGPVHVLDHNEKMYRIEQVTDTTEFSDKRYITKKEAQELCEAKDWKVTISADK